MRRLAISYARFSNPTQSAGASETRQAEDFAKFCARHDLTPSKEAFIDRGRSGYKGHHRTKGAMGRMEALARDGRIAPGTVLVVEAWDRLGRQRPDVMIEMIADLLRSGLSIGVCRLDDIFTLEDMGSHKFTTLSVFVQLAYQESLRKSGLVGDAWARKKLRARNGEVLTRRLPAWLKGFAKNDGNRVTITVKPVPERVAAVRRVFQLSADGLGVGRILERLNAEKVPAIGPSGKWKWSYIAKLLLDRRVLGECQMMRRNADGKLVKDGDVITGYYDAILTQAEWDAARLGVAERINRGPEKRRAFPGRPPKGKLNVFAGLLWDARTGERYHMENRADPKYRREQTLVSAAWANRTGEPRTFPLRTFESAVLSLLKEIPADEILPGNGGPNKVATLAAMLADAQHRQAEYEAELDNGAPVALFTKKLRELEGKIADTKAELEKARLEEAHPLEKAWDEAHDLMAILDRDDGPELRLKLQAVLRRAIDSIWLLVIPKGRCRLAAIQVWFAKDGDHDGERRDYVVYHKPASGNQSGRTEAQWSARSLASVAAAGDLNLRRPKDAKLLEQVLSELEMNG